MNPWRGGWVSARATCVVAGNPGPMTLDGTNTWVLAEPDAPEVIVVDPGPRDELHLRAVLAAAGERRVALVALTHGHPDHAEGAARLAELCGAPVRAADPTYGCPPLTGGEALDVAGLRLLVLATPGHTADSVSLALPAEDAVLTGDTVLGRGTTVVAYPDGALGAYLDSLHRLRDLAAAGELRRVLPGHGPVRDDPLDLLDGYLAHRAERLAEIEAAVAAGARSPREVVERVYADVDHSVWPAAELSVRAQLAYLGLPAEDPPTADDRA